MPPYFPQRLVLVFDIYGFALVIIEWRCQDLLVDVLGLFHTNHQTFMDNVEKGNVRILDFIVQLEFILFELGDIGRQEIALGRIQHIYKVLKDAH